MTPDKNALRQSAKELRQHLHETEKDAAETIASIFPEKLFTRLVRLWLDTSLLAASSTRLRSLRVYLILARKSACRALKMMDQ